MAERRASRGWRRIVRGLRDDGGASAVEMGLILPIFLAVIFGIVDVGRMYYMFNTLNSGVQQGGRYASLNNVACNSQIQTVVVNALTGLVAITASDVSVVDNGGTPATTTITASKTIPIIGYGWNLGSIMPNRTLSASVTVARPKSGTLQYSSCTP
jgi:Flp pilus assembly protein TadG